MFLEFDGNVITNILILKMPFKQESFCGEVVGINESHFAFGR
jgi:hypothetical protein